jgi:hypothetical protein
VISWYQPLSQTGESETQSADAIRRYKPDGSGIHFKPLLSNSDLYRYTKVWSLSAGEKFDEATCKAADLSPCTAAAGVNIDNWRGHRQPTFPLGQGLV